MDCMYMCGMIFLAWLAYKLARIGYNLLWPYIIGPAMGLSQDPAKLGQWAVVTGATDGIGKAYSEALAARGMNVYLMSRTEAKLQTVANEIKSQSPDVEVRTYQLDFGTDKLEDYEDVERTMGTMDVGVLVNNVGMSLGHPKYFLESSRSEVKKLLLVNDLSALMMTNIFLKGMVERKRGAVINIASTAALQPTPLLTVYSASKVFLDYFTQTLPLEYANTGVLFQVIEPAYVKTNMSRLKNSSFFAPEPDTFVKEALGTLGLMTRGSGCLAHTIQNTLTGMLPTVSVTSMTFKFMKTVRKRALRVKEKEASEKKDE